MLFSSLAVAVLSAMAMANPVLEKRGVSNCAADGSTCQYTGCWTETTGSRWCSPSNGNSPMTFSVKNVLFDTNMDVKKRMVLGQGIPSATVFKVIGQPKLTTGAKYGNEVKEVMANLARLSAPTAIEMRNIIGWGVELGTASGIGGGQYWAGGGRDKQGQVKFSEADWPKWNADTRIGFMAHECGHAIFDRGGYLSVLNQKLKERGIDNTATYGNIGGMVNEPFAGILAHRAWLYKHYDNPDKKSDDWKQLVWARDITSLFVPNTFYWNNYKLTSKAMEALPKLVDIGLKDLLPRFAQEYGLQKDKYLFLPANTPL